jgi:dipeptidyl-peptidase-4
VPDVALYDSIYQERYTGVPQDDPEAYRVNSPITYAAGLEGELLLVHGSADDNVHMQGTERLINLLIELGKPFDFMLYPNCSHAIKEGPGTLHHVYAHLARYLVEHLPPGAR